SRIRNRLSCNGRWSGYWPRKNGYPKSCTGRLDGDEAMKARDFGDFISTFADLLHDASADRQSEAWRSLVPVFQASPSANVSELCKIIRTMEMPSGGSGPT